MTAQENPQAYLETKVFPTLLPALEDLLRWSQQTPESERPVSSLEWLAQHLKRNNPNPQQNNHHPREYRGSTAQRKTRKGKVSSAFADEPLRCIFIGAPGCGKGTQAEFMKREFGIFQISTGDLLRAAVKSGSTIGEQAKQVMESGGLVSDDIIISLIEEAIRKPECSNGYLLDGFPRTVPQAEQLDQMLANAGEHLDRVFEFAIDDDLLVRRISGRRVHPASGRSYHVEFKPPKVADVDDETGEPLIQRSDDNEETLRKRLAAYHQYTEPVVEYYKSQGILVTLNASDKPDTIWASIQKNLLEDR